MLCLTFHLNSQNSTSKTIGIVGVHSATQADILSPANDLFQSLNEALQTIPQGGKIVLLEGTYTIPTNINESINLLSEQSVTGVGPQTIIEINNNKPLFHLGSTTQCKNVIVRDLSIKVNATNFDNPLILFESSNSPAAVIDDNEFINLKIEYSNNVTKVNLIELRSGIKSMIRDNRFINFDVGISQQTNQVDYINLKSNGRIRDNDFHHIVVKRKGEFNGNIITGTGINLVTTNTKAFILHNSFQHIKLPPIETGIFLGLGTKNFRSDVAESWINNNQFGDIYFEGFVIGIEFYKQDGLLKYNLARNMFRDLILQSKKESTNGIKNIFGLANSFIYCNIYDWKKRNIAVADKIIDISSDALFTTIVNPRLDLTDVNDEGRKTAVYANGASLVDLNTSTLNRTSQIQMYDPAVGNDIQTKFFSKSTNEGSLFKILTKDGNGAFTKKWEINDKGDIDINQKLKIEQIPEFTEGNILIENDKTVGKIQLVSLKNNLGITAIENKLENEKEGQKEMINQLLHAIQVLENRVVELENKLIAQ